MRFVDSLYTYGYKDKKVDKVIKKIKKGSIIHGLHLIVLPIVNDGILEIYVYNQLLQPFYKYLWDDIYVVGIASNKDGARELIQKIIQDMYDFNDDLNVKNFFGI